MQDELPVLLTRRGDSLPQTIGPLGSELLPNPLGIPDTDFADSFPPGDGAGGMPRKAARARQPVVLGAAVQFDVSVASGAS